MPHLLVDISAHGFGHVSQTAPVVNELARRIPKLRITLRTAAPAALLRQRFTCDFQHLPVAFDFGMQMTNAVDVRAEQSAAAYLAFHADWNDKVEHEAQAMRTLKPDLLLANVPYLSLAAAQEAGVRAVAMCSLNWADIYRHYCVRDAASAAVHAQMLAAYNSAEILLKVQPSMAMDDLRNARSIRPIAQVGRNRRTQINACLLPPPCRGRVGEGVETPLSHCPAPILIAPSLCSPPLQEGRDWHGSNGQSGFKTDPPEKLILLAMGGIEYRLPVECWRRIPGVRWLVPQAWGIERSDMTSFESLGLPFSDVLASCDAVLTKPGYGTFADAACAGVPVLYVSRRDWPEEPYLVQWLRQNGVCREVERERLQSGDFENVLRDLWSQPKPVAPVASGAGEAAEILEGML